MDYVLHLTILLFGGSDSAGERDGPHLDPPTDPTAHITMVVMPAFSKKERHT